MISFLAAAAASDSVSPTFIGMVVIVGLQLSNFFFNYRKDQSREQAAKKEDLTALRNEFKADLSGISVKVEGLRVDFDGRLEASRLESDRYRGELYTKVSDIGIQLASVAKGQAITEQTLTAISHKVDTLSARTPRPRS